ncbi:MAG: cyclodeaminase/cyclohydrolase family protein [Clostridiales bacterium]|jgi:formiminotetrahydrofolate cyclodeaminase|nr:cyclodeaminase/cyclohydrolase family protein [Clostridiales bacterium]
MKLGEMMIPEFMGKLAGTEPTPGGGSASALLGLIGVSLVQMVVNLTLGRKKYAEFEGLMNSVMEEAEAQRAALLEAIDQDAWAYNKVSAAYKLPKDTDEEKAARADAIQEALKIATLTPLNILNHCKSSLRLAHDAVGRSNTNAASDLGVAALALKAGMDGAWLNILINLASIKDENFKEDIKTKATDTLTQAAWLCDKINEYVMAELG